MKEARKSLRSDRLLLSQYTYNLEETVHQLDRHGKVKKTEVKLYEVFPSLDEKLSYRRLVEKNGKRLSEKKLRRQDRKQDRKLTRQQKRLSNRDATDRQRDLERARVRERQEIDEVFRLLKFTIVDRQSIDGVPTIRFRFEPRNGYRPRRKRIRILKKVRGEAWLAEADHQLVQLRVETISTISLGLGIVARLHKGSRLFFQRRRVNHEIWLPFLARVSGSGRLMLLKGFHFEATQRYSDYQKFSVKSSVQYPGGKIPR